MGINGDFGGETSACDQPRRAGAHGIRVYNPRAAEGPPLPSGVRTTSQQARLSE